MTRLSAVTTVLGAVTTLALTGCARSEKAAEPHNAPRLMLIDSIRLVDFDSMPLGTPGYILPVDRGYLIADPQNSRLLDFDRNGRVLRSIGRKGGGPSEFAGLGPLALTTDSTLYVCLAPRRFTCSIT